MSARDAILARVRAALDGAPEPPTPVAPRRTHDGSDLVGLFAERVADYHVTVERCSADEVPARVAAALPAGARVVVPPGLGVEISGSVVDNDLAHHELDALDAVVTRSRLGIAETGTIVLDHGPGQGRRVLSLIPDVHVCLVAAADVVGDVPDAIERLDPTRPLTWVSGPSATSDIELDRVEGVHGPRRLAVIVVS